MTTIPETTRRQRAPRFSISQVTTLSASFDDGGGGRWAR